jgi:hypothetical protein
MPARMDVALKFAIASTIRMVARVIGTKLG